MTMRVGKTLRIVLRALSHMWRHGRGIRIRWRQDLVCKALVRRGDISLPRGLRVWQNTISRDRLQRRVLLRAWIASMVVARRTWRVIRVPHVTMASRS